MQELKKLNGNRRSAFIIDLSAIKQNVIEIRKKVKDDVKICAVVKADAYGHGSVMVSKMLENQSLADYLAVATIDEGIELRDSGIMLPILILGLVMSDEAIKAIKKDLTLTACYKTQIDSINESAKSLNKIIKVHLKIDTGMGRIGCNPEEALELAKYLRNKKNINFEGIFSHFSVSEMKDKSFSIHQLNLFNDVIKDLEKNNIKIPIKHIANSGATLDLPESYLDMVRTGTIIYGYYPSDETSESIKLIPAMKLRSEIIFIKKVKRETSLSYGRTYFTKNDRYIATVPAGYADGISRLLSNNHQVKINKKFYPIAGLICMDSFLVDLGNDFYPIGTEVEIFGKNSTKIPDIARKLNTIPHEIICSIKRVKKY